LLRELGRDDATIEGLIGAGVAAATARNG